MKLRLLLPQLALSFIFSISSLYASESGDQDEFRAKNTGHSGSVILKEAGKGVALVAFGAGCGVYGAMELCSISNNLSERSKLYGGKLPLETHHLKQDGVWINEYDLTLLRTKEDDLMHLASGMNHQLSSYISSTGLPLVFAGGIFAGFGLLKISKAGWMCLQNVWDVMNQYSIVRKDKLD